MTRAKTHLTAIVLFVAAFVVAFAVAGCGGTVDKQGDAYKTVVAWATQLQKADFYQACSYEAYDGTQNVTDKQLEAVNETLGTHYSAQRYCAQKWSGVTVDILKVYPDPVTIAHRPQNDDLIYQAQVAYSLGIITKAEYKELYASAKAHDEKLVVPKNGYVFRISAKGYNDVYIGVQRDSEGNWKVVSVS